MSPQLINYDLLKPKYFLIHTYIQGWSFVKILSISTLWLKITKTLVFNVVCLQLLKPRTKVDIFYPFFQLPCTVGEICGVLRMTFHENLITPRHYSGLKSPFPNLDVMILDDMGNGIVLWHEKYLVAL